LASASVDPKLSCPQHSLFLRNLHLLGQAPPMPETESHRSTLRLFAEKQNQVPPSPPQTSPATTASSSGTTHVRNLNLIGSTTKCRLRPEASHSARPISWPKPLVGAQCHSTSGTIGWLQHQSPRFVGSASQLNVFVGQRRIFIATATQCLRHSTKKNRITPPFVNRYSSTSDVSDVSNSPAGATPPKNTNLIAPPALRYP